MTGPPDFLEKLGERIAIIGPSNSGKSTLAQSLGDKLGLPVIHLDQLAFRPDTNWQRVPDEELVARHNDAIKADRWIIEGNYSVCMPQRFARAQSLLWLDLPRWGCVLRYILRAWKPKSARKGGLDGSTGEFNFDMITWILWHSPRTTGKYRDLIARHPHLTPLILTSFAEVKALNRKIQRSVR